MYSAATSARPTQRRLIKDLSALGDMRERNRGELAIAINAPTHMTQIAQQSNPGIA